MIWRGVEVSVCVLVVINSFFFLLVKTHDLSDPLYTSERLLYQGFSLLPRRLPGDHSKLGVDSQAIFCLVVCSLSGMSGCP